MARPITWRAVDHEGEVLETYVTKRRDRKAALKFLRKTMKLYGSPHVTVTGKLRSYGATMKVIGNAERQEPSFTKRDHFKLNRTAVLVGGDAFAWHTTSTRLSVKAGNERSSIPAVAGASQKPVAKLRDQSPDCYTYCYTFCYTF